MNLQGEGGLSGGEGGRVGRGAGMAIGFNKKPWVVNLYS